MNFRLYYLGYNSKKLNDMKRNLIILVMLAMPFIGNAQREVGSWTFIPKVGINIAKLTDPDIYLTDPDIYIVNDQKMEYTNKIGLVAGAELEYQLYERFSLSGGLLYSNQGTKTKDNPEFRNTSSTLHYLNIPLTANIYIAPDFAFHVGLQPGFALKKHIEEETKDEHGNWINTSSEDTWFKTFDLSIPIGLSYNIGAIQIDARYNLGLTNATKYDAVKIHNRVIQLTLGYRFAL